MKHCTNCNTNIHDEAVVCTACGVPVGKVYNNCEYCGSTIQHGAFICTSCGKPIKGGNTASGNQKSKLAAGLLGILVGSLGIHNFYLGYTTKGIIQILLTILSCGMLSIVSGIWGLVEGVLILTDENYRDADGNLLK